MPTAICHLTSVHPADDIRIFHNQCRSLAHAGFAMHLVAFGFDSTLIDGVQIQTHHYTDFPTWDGRYQLLKEAQGFAERILGRRFNVYP